jgi:hypothetical protein
MQQMGHSNGLFAAIADLDFVRDGSGRAVVEGFNWNREKLTETYWENSEKVLDEAGLEVVKSPSTTARPLPSRTKSRSAMATFSEFSQ